LPSEPNEPSGISLSGMALKMGVKVAVINNKPTITAIFLYESIV